MSKPIRYRSVEANANSMWLYWIISISLTQQIWNTISFTKIVIVVVLLRIALDCAGVHDFMSTQYSEYTLVGTTLWLV